jgi:cyclase
MSLPRVIPVLLLHKKGLYKSVRFKKLQYVGDPFNAVKIFNEKEVDELIIIDIEASKVGSRPNYDYLKDIATECFMPLTYGGGINTIDQIKNLIQSGVEKVVINSAHLKNQSFIKAASESFGSSTIVAAIDIKKNLFGKYQVYDHVNKKSIPKDPIDYVLDLRNSGAGEIFLNNVDLDGTMVGYDIEFIRRVTAAVDIPIIACGGAGKIQDLYDVIINGSASAAGAGSMFVFYGKHNAVLITYPEHKYLSEIYQAYKEKNI